MNLFLPGVLAIFVMNLVANLLIPMPITPTTLWLAQFDHPFWVIAASTLGAVTGWLLFHPHIYRLVDRKPQLIAKIPKAYFDCFGNRILLWVFILNALPFPLDFMRFIAAAKKYPPLPLSMAIGAGRLIRNSLLVFVGVWLSQYQLWFWAVIALLFLTPLLAAAITKLIHRLNPHPPKTASALSILELELDTEQA
ncbi:MAG: hypothetical protein VKJ04_04625 [Vampirovibrionales bacterium]|nr:hypothetical protein [Vampirovibrionales bacterium]